MCKKVDNNKRRRNYYYLLAPDDDFLSKALVFLDCLFLVFHCIGEDISPNEYRRQNNQHVDCGPLNERRRRRRRVDLFYFVNFTSSCWFLHSFLGLETITKFKYININTWTDYYFEENELWRPRVHVRAVWVDYRHSNGDKKNGSQSIQTIFDDQTFPAIVCTYDLRKQKRTEHSIGWLL